MSQLEAFISRHGEPATYGMLENWARYVGKKFDVATSLEEIWEAFMADMMPQPQMVVARVVVRR